MKRAWFAASAVAVAWNGYTVLSALSTQAALVIDILQGKTTAAEAARQHALTLAEVEQWKDDFIT